MSGATMDRARRFGGVSRLYGEEALRRFAAAHVCVVGIGGVGSWAAEALARSAIGEITLIDLDMIAESNVNRQIHALDNEYGKAKVDAMATRILAINPDCRVHCVEEFVTVDSVQTTFATGFDFVIDAIDQVRVKSAMIAWCRAHKQPIVTAGAAGGKLDPTRVEIADLSRTIQDPLLSKVRGRLRKDHDFPRDPQKKFGISAVYSSEPTRSRGVATACEATQNTSAGLNCAGFGSCVTVTAVFGLTAANVALRQLMS